jgi:hypothetical protein
VNAFGKPVRDPFGNPISYSRAELPDATRIVPNAGASSNFEGVGSDVPASWMFASLGVAIGAPGIAVLSTRNGPEVLTAGSYYPNNYWYVLRYSPATGNYDQTFVSEVLTDSIVRLGAADVAGDRNFEIVVALSSGEIRLYDQDTRKLLDDFPTVPSLTGMTLSDLTGDGKAEIILVTPTGLSVFAGSGTLLWDEPGVGGYDVVAAQMDDDPSLEIATTSGDVVDAATQTVQWHWPDQFGFRVRAADIDGDGRDELVAAENWYFVWAYDVERQLPKWSIPTDLDIGAIALADIDCDARPDLLVGDGQWGEIAAYDTTTQQRTWGVGNPEHGTTFVAFGDPDGDGLDEVLWGAGATSSGPDRLYVAGIASESIEWQSVDYIGPFVGPQAGDIDGDGVAELVALTSLSDAGYSGGRILVFDAATLRQKASSGPISSGFFPLHDLKLRNLDADQALEIVVAMSYFYDGGIDVYDFDAPTGNFTLAWTNTVKPSGSPFLSVDVADVDLDGNVEIVAGGSRVHTGADGVFVYVYDYATRDVEWHSFQLGSTWSGVREVAVLSSGGGHPDIVAIVDGANFYGFDGVTKEALQITPGTFTALSVQPYAPARALLLGDASGTLHRYDRGPATYVLGASHPLGTDPIDGVSPLANGAVLVGSGGRLRFYPALPGSPAWTSVPLGAPFGRRIGRGSGVHARFFSAGAIGISEVAPSSPLLTLVPSSGPAAGGTVLVATGSGFQPGAGMFLGATPAAGVMVDGATQVQGITPALAPGSLSTVTILNPDTSFSPLDRAFFADFLDVDGEYLFHDFVETIFRNGVTAGCGAGSYCPDALVTRAQMAVFLVRARFGPNFTPADATGEVFSDVPCGSFAADAIEHLAAFGVTAGCGGGNYCPNAEITRAQAAVFLLRTLEGPLYVAPPAQGIFVDVPIADPFASWIEELSGRGITAGCGGGAYCPAQPTTRGQIAVFLVQTFPLG